MAWPELSGCLVMLNALSERFEVLMIRRRDELIFGGLFVFPGGKTDPADQDERWLEHLGIEREIMQETHYSQPVDLTSAKITAIRETFEETGVFLGLGSPSGSCEFLSDCVGSSLHPSVEKLHFINRFITPSFHRRRYDNISFLCLLESPVEIQLNSCESTEYIWATPAYLIEEYNSQRMNLILPQLYILGVLARFRTVSELFSYSFQHIPLTLSSYSEGPVHLPGDYRNHFTPEPLKRLRLIHEVFLSPFALHMDPGISQFFNKNNSC